MKRERFDYLTSKACSILKEMSKDQIAEYAFDIAKAANWYYFQKKIVKRIK